MAPTAEAYRDSLLFYTNIYERLTRIARQVQEVMSLTGMSDINAVKQWLSTAAESDAKQRVNEIVVGWTDFDPASVIHDYRSRVYGVYDLAVGADVRADLVDSHCRAFVGQFGITAFFDVNKGTAK